MDGTPLFADSDWREKGLSIRSGRLIGFANENQFGLPRFPSKAMRTNLVCLVLSLVLVDMMVLEQAKVALTLALLAFLFFVSGQPPQIKGIPSKTVG